jgi:hypothetical protein
MIVGLERDRTFGPFDGTNLLTKVDQGRRTYSEDFGGVRTLLQS